MTKIKSLHPFLIYFDADQHKHPVYIVYVAKCYTMFIASFSKNIKGDIQMEINISKIITFMLLIGFTNLFFADLASDVDTGIPF